MDSIRIKIGTFGKDSVSVDVLKHDAAAGILVLNKPKGVLSMGNPSGEHFPDCVRELKQSRVLGEESPRLGAIYLLDQFTSGVTIIGLGAEAIAHYRNLYGSGAMTLGFDLLVTSAPDTREVIECDLPLFFDEAHQIARVSHAKGKKAHTRFEFVRSVGFCQLWRAETCLLREDQIRLHAMEVGLGLVGEKAYSAQGDIIPGVLQGKGSMKALNDGVGVHLRSVSCRNEFMFEASAPKWWKKVESFLGKHYG